MEPEAPRGVQGQREEEPAKLEVPVSPLAPAAAEPGVRKETAAGGVLAANGQQPGVPEAPGDEGPPCANGREDAPEGEAPGEPAEPQEAASGDSEQSPGEAVLGGGSSLPPSPPASPPAGVPDPGAEGAPRARPAPASPPTPPDFYCVKWIRWKGERTPIITQSENGPCPLLAIMNTLFLQWKVKLPPQKEVITSDELMAHLGDCILSIKPQQQSEALQLNFQQNVNDAMTVLPKLSTGLDVNVRFTGVSDFEYTPECIVFDLLSVPLYHGWLVDPQTPDVAQAVGKMSYNQLVEKIITCKHSTDPNLVTEGLIAEQFLESTASQLTYHGLCELTSTVKEGELSVFFRNNHFSTMIKHQGHLYLLVTDQGFLQEEQVAWESLHNVDGDSCFCDAEFHLSHVLGKEAAGGAPLEQQLSQRQVDQDYLIALSLQQQQGGPALSDLELAQQLQQEEYQQQQLPAPQPATTPPPQGRSPTPSRPAGERRQRAKQDSDCAIL
ncbi:ubiquitin carboxyl-terminal hydrolase MINDY-1 [Varanus komodoensis]|uniref:Ubiquitin carboxyl-terminal hydrolase n=1 Tax=Varanus komodoensis TaxID=61221 RepID=A0A8D2KST1_VARKO|nr:ubiquitin carboxyl-terminal hydrolase MINDY-1 [Varanus komodoensis]